MNQPSRAMNTSEGPAIGLRLPVGSSVVVARGLLDQDLVHDRHGCADQRGLDQTALAGAHLADDRAQRAIGAGQRRAEIDKGRGRPERLTGQTAEPDRAADRLAHAVEPDPFGQRSFGMIGRGGGQDDVVLDGAQAVIVQPEMPQRTG